MATKKKRIWYSTSGAVTLEACIALPIFLFLMLFMFSFLEVFEARNQIAHVMLTTADSLAKDSLANEVPDENHILEQLLNGITDALTPSNGTFADTSKWYNGSEKNVEDAIRTRFLAYLSEGDESEAERVLKQLNVVNGLEGLDFSESYLKDGHLYIIVKYTLNYEFQVFGQEGLEIKQSCCSRLWKPGGVIDLTDDSNGSTDGSSTHESDSGRTHGGGGRGF